MGIPRGPRLGPSRRAPKLAARNSNKSVLHSSRLFAAPIIAEILAVGSAAELLKPERIGALVLPAAKDRNRHSVNSTKSDNIIFSVHQVSMIAHRCALLFEELFPMKRSISICALSIIIWGCTSQQHPSVFPIDRLGALRTSGGVFGAKYAGTWSGTDACVFLKEMMFAGAGSATFLHRSTENGSIGWFREPYCNPTGTMTLTVTSRPRSSVVVYLRGGLPCESYRPVAFQVMGGTGRFANASGSGTIKFTCRNNHTYSDVWNGTLKF